MADKVVGLRVGPGEQAEGLDLGEHGEVGYDSVPGRPEDDAGTAAVGALIGQPAAASPR